MIHPILESSVVYEVGGDAGSLALSNVLRNILKKTRFFLLPQTCQRWMINSGKTGLMPLPPLWPRKFFSGMVSRETPVQRSIR